MQKEFVCIINYITVACYWISTPLTLLSKSLFWFAWEEVVEDCQEVHFVSLKTRTVVINFECSSLQGLNFLLRRSSVFSHVILQLLEKSSWQSKMWPTFQSVFGCTGCWHSSPTTKIRLIQVSTYTGLPYNIDIYGNAFKKLDWLDLLFFKHSFRHLKAHLFSDWRFLFSICWTRYAPKLLPSQYFFCPFLSIISFCALSIQVN